MQAHPDAQSPSPRGGQSVLGWVLPHLFDYVSSQGYDADRLRNLPGIRHRNLDDPDVRVPDTAAVRAWEVALEITGDPALGLHVAESLPRGALDLVEYAFRSSPSLTVGLERLARYGRVLSDRFAARVERSGPDLLLLLADAGDIPMHPARAEFSLAISLRLARDGTGQHLVPLSASFRHPAPPDVSDYQQFFGPGITFSAGASAIILKGSDGDLPLRDTDPALSAIVRRRLDKVLRERDRPGIGGTTAAHVRRILIEDLGQGTPSPSAIARKLGTSTRTLGRRLADEHTSFRTILDDVRKEFAMALLQDSALSIADIAFFLQYSEPAAFHRTFRRWTGQTPRQYRKRDPAA